MHERAVPPYLKDAAGRASVEYLPALKPGQGRARPRGAGRERAASAVGHERLRSQFTFGCASGV